MSLSPALRHDPTAPLPEPVRLRRPLHGLVVIGGIALVAAALRLPYLHALVSSDEGGFLTVARGWHAEGASLYGDHWVDRPPLLLAIYKLAVLGGGLTSLRLLGALAVAATVFAVGAAARQVAGRGAGLAAAVVAAALLASPLLGTVAVNGELLAAPFVAAGIWAVTLAYTSGQVRVVRGASLVAGAAAASALLVKQNMADVLVFGAVLGFVAWRGRQLGAARLRAAARWGAAGFAAAGGLVLGAASALGSSPTGVVYAMYPFRVRAATVMAYVPWSLRWSRIGQLGEVFLVSCGPVLLVLLLVALATRRLEVRVRPVAVATLGLAAYAVVSILAGGSYWSHYLVQLVVPTALAAGVAAGARAGLTDWLRPALALAMVSAALGWVTGLHTQVDASGQVVGRSIRQSSTPGDSVVSLLGDGALVESSGLSAPYPYLWSLPSRTLDPDLDQLSALLRGSDAPTWVVVRGPETTAYVEQRPAGAALRDDYRLAGVVCGRSIYLHDGLSRPAPVQSSACHLPLT